jgi:peptidoglycan/LPS O-acetylase OafA/YrhL
MVSTSSGAATRPAPGIRTAAVDTAQRLYFLDNLRVALTVLVIAHHVGQAYGPTGGAWPIGEAARAAILGPFFMVNRSFFMSLFFMVSGYLMVMSVDAIGARAFLQSRVRRLGMPLLVVGLISIPVQLLLVRAPGSSGFGASPVEVGHLWFIEHLLIFSAVYALWRMLRPGRAEAGAPRLAIPGYLPIVAFALCLAAVSFVVRIWYPIDKWVYLLGFIKVAWADVPRDLSFFVIGAVAYRQQWLLRFPARTGYRWLATGLVLSVVAAVYMLWLRPLFPVSRAAWGVIYPVWESLLCCGLCIGLTVLFRERLNYQGKLGKTLAQRQYGAYIWHVVVVVVLQAILLHLALPPIVKFALVTLVAVPVTFWVVGLMGTGRGRRHAQAVVSRA